MLIDSQIIGLGGVAIRWDNGGIMLSRFTYAAPTLNQCLVFAGWLLSAVDKQRLHTRGRREIHLYSQQVTLSSSVCGYILVLTLLMDAHQHIYKYRTQVEMCASVSELGTQFV